jgi:hypothetical protein
MTILINDCLYVWHGSLGDADFLAGLEFKDGLFICNYRFRYHVDNKVFDSKDRKNWYEVKVKADSVEAVIMKFDLTFTLLPGVEGLDLREVDPYKRMDAVMERWPTAFHMQTVKTH